MAAWRNGAPTHVKTHIRKKILARDGYTCQQCGSPAAEVDHIDNKTQREAQAARAARVARVKRPPTPSFCDIPHISRFDTDRG